MVETGTAGSAPLLRAERVRKVYRTGAVEVEALRCLDLEVAQGELVAAMGLSGSGKTTLSNCLSGLDDIDSGRVCLGGVAPSRRGPRRSRRARAVVLPSASG